MAIHEHGLYGLGSLGMNSRSYLVPWSEWHALSDYGPNGLYLRNPELDGPRLLRIKHNEMEMDLADTRLVRWRALLLVEPLVSGMNALTFDLVNNAYYPADWQHDAFYPVRVESVSDAAGEPLPHAHRKDQLMVFLPRPTTAGTPLTLAVEGAAEVVYQLTAESYGLLQSAWYPQYGYVGGRFSFDWTVRVPHPFLVTGSGKVAEQHEDGARGQNVIRLKSDVPVTFPWVIFGRFQKHETESAGRRETTPGSARRSRSTRRASSWTSSRAGSASGASWRSGGARRSTATGRLRSPRPTPCAAPMRSASGRISFTTRDPTSSTCCASSSTTGSTWR
jgi:hypothetical protein